MWAFLRHPLIVALVGIIITGLLVPYFARRWQNQQKALEVRVGLVTDMSECAMGLIARVQGVLRLTRDSHLSEEQQGKPPDELRAARKRLRAAREAFEVREAVVGTKLEVYFVDSDIPSRWDTLARELADLADLEGLEDPVGEAEHRAALRDDLLLDGLLDRKAVLIKDVLRAPWVFPTSWVPWRR